ncbi:adenine deaminase [Thermogladius sp. 4427co]|uniref:adenine deaminase n=1 Tax=Thermogladius sp. 4427co TaxID=3450718 RepID=UPI003F796BA1
MNKLFRYDPAERRDLIKTARGLIPADLVVTNTNLVSVATGEVLEGKTVIVKGRRIAGIVDDRIASKYIGSGTLVIDGKGRYLVPGFIDPHIHIESSLLDPYGFAKIALKHGTTTVVADPHEIGNVLGVEGVRIFSEAASKLPLKILIDLPSCVPATNPNLGLETIGNIISSSDMHKLIELDNVIGLGEVMDFFSVVNYDEEVLEKIRIAYEKGLVVNGHAPLLPEEMLNAYISAGIYSDHESTLAAEALEKVRRGMFVFAREGSAWRDLKALFEVLARTDCELCAFTSDDLNVAELFEKGHMDRVVNEAIEMGMDPVRAIKYASLKPAMRLHLEEHIGLVAPGRLGDFFLSKRLEYLEPETVVSNGEVIYYDGELKKEFPKPTYPEYALKTVNLRKIPSPSDLIPSSDIGNGAVKANIIRVQPGSALTKWVTEVIDIRDHKPILHEDELYVAVIERHKGTGNIGKGIVKGLGVRIGGIAQTIAHDTHNIIVAGTNPEDMSLAVKIVHDIQGGIVAVNDKEVVGIVELKLAGLMSVKEPEEVYAEFKRFVNRMKEGFQVEFESFFMTLSLVALPVIPELRITDRGLVDVVNARLVPLFIT